MSQCTLLAHVKKPDGTVVESKLFKDLLNYCASRQEAKENYAVATNAEFLRTVEDRVQYDENGEITLASYADIVNIDYDGMQDKLNKEIKAGEYEYKDAIEKLQSFNRSHPMRNKYLATLQYDNGKYNLSVVRHTKAAEEQLNDVIQRQSTMNVILYYLAQAGVSVGSLEQAARENGRYSTLNAAQTLDGLYQLIRIKDGEDVTDVLAEEAGHFTIGALGDNPLVSRLVSLLDENTIRTILGDAYDGALLGSDPAREMAGRLVGQALIDKIENKSPWGRLAHRIADQVKKIFAKINKDDVKLATIQARETADKIAKGFLSPDFTGTVQKALRTEETLYNNSPSVNVRVYRHTLKNLSTAAHRMQAICKTQLSETVQKIVTELESTVGIVSGQNNAALENSLALEGIANAISNMLTMLEPDGLAATWLNNIDFDNSYNFTQNMRQNSTALAQLRSFVKYGFKILEELNDALNKDKSNIKQFEGDTSNVTITGRDIYGVITIKSVDLDDMYTSLRNILNDIKEQLDSKDRSYFAKFLTDIYGQTYVTLSTRRVFKHKQKDNINLLPQTEEGKKMLAEEWIRDNLASLDHDTSWFAFNFYGATGSNDIILQLVDKCIKQCNKNADDIVFATLDRIKLLRQKYYNLRGDSSFKWLYEKFDDGTLTGNYASPLHWGKWEKKRHEFIEEEKENFRKTVLAGNTYNRTQAAVLWQAYLSPRLRQWNAANSTWSQEKERWIPCKALYRNEEFEQLMQQHPEYQEWYDEYMELKRNMDDRLPAGSTLDIRAPQFKGTYVERVKNRLKSNKNPLRAASGAAARSFADMFAESSEDRDYGSLQTYNDKDESLYYGEIALEDEQIDRVALYGINKLQNLDELSTNPFYSLLAYSSMAVLNQNLNAVNASLQIGNAVLQNREVIGNKEDERGANSRAYRRYAKYIEKQVFGIACPRKAISFKNSAKIVLNKIVNVCNRAGSLLFLGGNLEGAVTNLGTGTIEMLKEAGSGEYYNMKDWSKAFAFYNKYLIPNFIQSGRIEAANKLDLLLERFNADTNNKTNVLKYHATTWNAWTRWRGTFDDIMYLPYSLGDRFMQSMSYLSLLYGTKVYDENGHEHSLMQIYRVEDNEDLSDNTKAGKTLGINGVFYKEKTGKIQYEEIESQIRAVILNGAPMFSVLNSTVELLRRHNIVKEGENDIDLNNKRYTIQEKTTITHEGNPVEVSIGMANLIHDLRKAQSELVWGQADESDLSNKAREINNKMHGVYNYQDKGIINQRLLGQLFMAMKGWAVGMIQRRFESSHYSVVLGDYTEGTMISMWKLFFSAFNETGEGGWKRFFQGFFFPLSKNYKQDLQDAGYSVKTYYNARRAWLDKLAILILTLIRVIMAPDKDKDKEEDEEDIAELADLIEDYDTDEYGNPIKSKKSKEPDTDEILAGWLYYYACRLANEQSALNTTWGIKSEWLNLADATPVAVAAIEQVGTEVVDIIGAMNTIHKEKKLGVDDPYSMFFDDEGNQIPAPNLRKDNPFFYQQSFPGRYEKFDPKYEYRFKRYVPYYKSVIKWKYPYEAAKSYEYGRTVKSR